jgi:hypothetical protein|tara:strand:+ start:62 stop:601 length:540 start_codon:yes stop_codon:yes gene_type:complete
MVRKAIIFVVILFFCGFISFISINGTDNFYGRSQVANITYKLPERWVASTSEKQFRLLEISLERSSDFSVILFSNIQGTADQNIQRWVNQFQVDASAIEVTKDTFDSKNLSIVELYGTYEVPNMLNRNATKELKENYGLLGGVVEFGNSIYFVKAVGNNEDIKQNKEKFNDFVNSISLK